MNRLSFFILIILLAGVFSPYILIPKDVYATSTIPSNKFKGFSLGVDTKSFGNDLSIVVKGDKSYLYLGRGVFYPIDPSYIKSYNTIFSNKSIRRLETDLKDFPLRLILEYKSIRDRDILLNLVPRLGGKILFIYHAFPFIAVDLPLKNFSAIYNYAFSLKVMVDYKVSIDLNESVSLVKPPRKWSELEYDLGHEINGSGIVIGILDTGIYSSHPDFYFPNGTCKIMYNVSFVPGEDALDRFGHGTHVAGIAAGTGLASNGVFKGVAPGAYLANIKVLADNGSGYVSWILEGVEYAVNNSIDIINLSFGGGGNGAGDDPLSLALDIAAGKGVVSVVAAGNNGPYYYSLDTPAVSRSAITVGAIDKNLSIAFFSSRGPAGDIRIKPDVLAPGVDVIAPLAKKSYIEKIFHSRYPEDIINGVNGDYVKLSGTSMATPHVAGIAALILQMHRNYSPIMVKSAIMTSSIELGLDQFTEGNGLINAYYAVKNPVLIINSSNSFGPEYNWSKSISYKIMNIDDDPHRLRIISKTLYKLYDSTPMSFDNFFRISNLSSVISPHGSIILKVDLQSPLPIGVYYSRVNLMIDDIFNISLTFSLAKMIKIVANITYHEKYIDGIFVMYNKKHPHDLIFPAGYKYSKGVKFNYSVWFYVEPGNYSLFAASMNLPNESSYFINGPMYVATRSLILFKNVEKVPMQFKVEYGIHFKIPMHDSENNLIIPYFRIMALKLGGEMSFGIFSGGIWNISSSDIYFSLTSKNDTVFLNFQFIKIPRYFSQNIMEGLNYLSNLYTASWIFKKNPYEFKLPILYRYDLESNSTVDNDLGTVGLAVFPPGFNITYVGLVNFYQGGKYIVYTSPLHYEEEIGVLILDLEGVKYRSLAVLDPETFESRDIRSVAPPYLPFTYIDRGIRDENYYLNITNALLTTYSPFNVIAEGNSRVKIFANSKLIYHGSECGDLDYHEADYLKWIKGNYSIYSDYNLTYPLYQKIISQVYFNTSKTDYMPPIPYEFKIPIVIEKNSTIDLSFLENLCLKNIDLTFSWDNGRTWKRSYFDLSAKKHGLYNMYTINSDVKYHRAMLSIRIYVEDISGNYINITMYNVSTPRIETYKSIPNIYFYPRYVYLNENISVYAKDDGNNIYGLPIYLDSEFLFNIPINGTGNKSIFLRNLIYYDSLGEHILKTFLGYNVLNRPITIYSKLSVTYLSILNLTINNKKAVEKTDGLVVYRADVGSSIDMKISIVWAHNNSPASKVHIVVNESNYVTSKKGSVIIPIKSNLIGISSYEVKKIYYVDNLTGCVFDHSISNYTSIKIIWDEINLSLISDIKDRYPVNTPINILFNAEYSYDHKPFAGKLILNNGEMLMSSNGGLSFYIYENNVGKHTYYITHIIDDKYNLSKFTPLNITVVFDEIGAEYLYNATPVSIDILVHVYFLSDRSPVEKASVVINGVKANEVLSGSYRAKIIHLPPPQIIKIKIRYDCYQPLSLNFYVGGSIYVFYLPFLIAAIVAITILLYVRKYRIS